MFIFCCFRGGVTGHINATFQHTYNDATLNITFKMWQLCDQLIHFVSHILDDVLWNVFIVNQEMKYFGMWMGIEILLDEPQVGTYAFQCQHGTQV